MSKADVHIYTDGAATGNPGPGGYGIVMEWVGTTYKKEYSEGFKHTTNNRMELLAVIKALEKLKKEPLNVVVFSDSMYVVNAIEKGWVFKWETKEFKDKKNVDLWKALLPLYRKHKVRFQWVKGHNNHPQNERCDWLATKASKQKILNVDRGFINSGSKEGSLF